MVVRISIQACISVLLLSSFVLSVAGTTQRPGVGSGKGSFGVDVSSYSSPISVSTWNCLQQQGFTFAIIRAYRDVGATDPHLLVNVENALAAGLYPVDIYHMPDTQVAVDNQIVAVERALNATGKNLLWKIGRYWIDVEIGATWRQKSQNGNLRFIKDMEDFINMNYFWKIPYGIYTSKDRWDTITGGGTASLTPHPLWWIRIGNPSYDGYEPFSGRVRTSIPTTLTLVQDGNNHLECNTNKTKCFVV